MSDMTDSTILGFLIPQYLDMKCVTWSGEVSAGTDT